MTITVASSGRVLRFTTTDGYTFAVHPERRAVCYERKSAGRTFGRTMTFPEHPITAYVFEWLLDEGTGRASAWLSQCVVALLGFVHFLAEEERIGLSAEAFSGYLSWLKRQPGRKAKVLAESTRRGYATAVQDFLFWSWSEGMLTRRDVDDIEIRFSRAFKGFRERERRRAQDCSISSEDLQRLYEAIRMELEMAERTLEDGPGAQDAYDPVFPLLPFPMLLGILLAVRSAELNVLEMGDVHWRPEQIHVHAPNKRRASLYMLGEIQRAWGLARRWQSRYRSDMDDPTRPALVCVELARGRTAKTQEGGRLIQLDSLHIQNQLRRFYQKYFSLHNERGEPVLFRVDPNTSEKVPFDLSFGQYRAAAITEYARHETDLTKLKLFARHECLSTTEASYIRQSVNEERDVMVLALGPFSERVRMRVYGRPAAAEEMEAAQRSGGLVPGGACLEVLQGIRTCRRATDCRLCPFFLIDPRRREWFVEDADQLRERAGWIERERGNMREVQNLQGLAAINDAIVAIIDECREGLQ